MRKLLTISCILLISLCTTSCINVLESIFIRANGSGTYSFAIDMSSMKSMLQMAGEEFDSDELLKEMNMDEASAIAKLDAIDGVSNAGTSFDEESFTIAINFEFENIDALNKGMSTYLADSTETNPEMIDYFSMNRKTITRISLNKFLDTFKASIMESAEDEGVDMAMVKMMFGDMYLASEIKTERRLKSFNNEEYLQKDDNTISWKFYPFRDEDAKPNMGVTLKTK